MFGLTRKKLNKYKIIPLGTYCLPRVITTVCGLKLRKKDGEKSCPFDLGFFNDINCIIELLDNKFTNFFDDMYFDDEKSFWVNEHYNVILNHDGKLSKKQLITRYNKRIDNLYEYINDKSKHLYFLIATFNTISDVQLKRLLSIIQKYRDNTNFSLIIINQSESIINYPELKDNVHVIDLSKDKTFSKINKRGLWVKHLKRRQNIYAIIFYYKLYFALKKIIK